MQRFIGLCFAVSTACLTVSASLVAQTAAPTPAPVPVPGIPTSAQAPPSPPSVPSQSGSTDSRYKVHNQDTLLISFPLSPELNQTVTIQPDGYVNLLSAGSIRLTGLTVPQIVEAVRNAYAGILKNPIVSVDLTDYQKPFFTVSGQVGKPGRYELRDSIKVSEALAIAGGLAPTAKTQLLLFHRASDEWYEVSKLNLKAVYNGKKLEQDALVQPGDMIIVPEKAITNFKKYVPYTVNAGGYLPLN